ncbi:MAG: carbon-nitrogen hydrolase family protein, partial [Candidatus Latescibacteria bacterium]|nr:carbon-nitrogen hydrolase family protein [Candidatus Latescibacterota bacterium]
MKSRCSLRSAAAAVLLTAVLNTTVAAAPPREVWVATVTLMSQFGSPHDTVGDTVNERIDRVIERMEEAAAYDPDIVCLTEVFPHASLRNLPPVPERAEAVPGPIISRIAGYARRHRCYVICPLLTKRDGRVYNSGVLIDRKGGVAGVYDKIHPTEGEIESGITPGSLDPPVFETDFGKIG